MAINFSFGFPINRPEEGTTHNKLDEVNVNQNVGVHQSMQTWKYVHYNLTDIGIVKSTNLELDNDYEYEISEVSSQAYLIEILLYV